jgi:hypothetical protein
MPIRLRKQKLLVGLSVVLTPEQTAVIQRELKDLLDYDGDVVVVGNAVYVREIDDTGTLMRS